jgi:hypothetical protein
VGIFGQLRLQFLHLVHESAMEQLIFQQFDELVYRKGKHGAQDEGQQRGGEQETGAQAPARIHRHSASR